ncbi:MULTISPECIES: Holliday junction branch migration protein RuvA [unclassified Candidatus Tisiphia]|jgi:Holliday junction DNA helicase RuvA|uniref:Holliday junction branch migration protein RuvA n=1 Tax=unclassified Candidatus Tisiphia TaxID=2996318 RepID=UPI001E6EEC4C|nr:Holliday junction branch migration protein RuvA [Rickettsiaceae bacterium]MDD9337021.1 Holliday junction branch migration protein RuvA [Rickettsiaceae bacterium]MDR0329252.1 Holliday junction branch migration protein RuvA [Rickettsia sp.]UCM92084.1 MAG: Holliday junction branch migration protein RuvA [Rickettsia endosymbiont of Cimex lectularius]
MIGKLKGKIDACFNDYVIIDVSGVGYLVYCSSKTLNKLVVNEFCQLFIETHVREDHINLYGFLSLEEKAFFNLLQSVNGIGTRMALAILSNLSPEQIQSAIARRDKEAFKAISGVGLKLAERIIIELKDKALTNFTNNLTMDNNDTDLAKISSDATLVLTSLGIGKTEAQNLVQGIIAENSNLSINELIKLALKARGSNV